MGRANAVGTIKATYEKYPNAARILPAMGYGAEQVAELEALVRANILPQLGYCQDGAES